MINTVSMIINNMQLLSLCACSCYKCAEIIQTVPCSAVKMNWYKSDYNFKLKDVTTLVQGHLDQIQCTMSRPMAQFFISKV